MKKTIRLWYCDFWPGFRPQNHFTYGLISQNFDILLDPKTPDYLIYGCFGSRHLRYDCVRIFYAIENLRPDFNLCDYAVGFDRLAFGDRYFRFPYFAAFRKQYEALANRPALSRNDLRARSRFCNFIYSNPNADPIRDEFFHLLAAARPIDSPGRHLNNMPEGLADRHATDWHAAKLPFMSRYRFTIAFENAATPGYATEKLLDAFTARTAPIYWGDPDIAQDFNPESFIDCSRFDTLQEVVDEVLRLERDEEALLAMINASPFVGGAPPERFRVSALAEFLDHIFEQPLSDARRRTPYAAAGRYELQRRLPRMAELRRLIAVEAKRQSAKWARRMRPERSLAGANQLREDA